MLEIVENEQEIENLYKAGSNAPYEPLEKGQFGYLGVLLSRKLDGKVQCHICGEWVTKVLAHAVNRHKISSIKYRKRFGFSLSFPLCSQLYSANRSILSKKQKHEQGHKPIKFDQKKRLKKVRLGVKAANVLNSNNLCHEQILKRVSIVADKVGHFPTSSEMIVHDESVLAGIIRRYKSWNEFKKAEYGHTDSDLVIKKVYDRDKVISQLRAWMLKNKRLPRPKDFVLATDETPNKQTIYNHFGSWNRAVALAGLK